MGGAAGAAGAGGGGVAADDSALFNFESSAIRNSVFDLLMNQPSLETAVAGHGQDIRRVMLQWQRGDISNFQYLSFLNSVSV